MVRLGVRHRRLAVPAHDDGADGRRAGARPRSARDVPLAGAPRGAPRQPADGRRLRDHAAADGAAVAAGRPAGPGPPRALCTKMVVTLVVAQVGWILLLRRPPVDGVDRCRRRRCWSASSWPGRSLAEKLRRRLPVARPPHRRALRPDGDHRARRGAARHQRRPRRADRGRLDGRGRRARPGRRPPWPSGSGGPTSWSRPATCSPPTASAPSAWGYGHIPVFGAVVAIGAGLHAAAYYLERRVRPSTPPARCSRSPSRSRSTPPASTRSTAC